MPIINAQIKGQGGVQPSGTITVQNNGTYDVTNYAVADVQVPTTAPTYYVEKSVDLSGNLGPKANAPIINFSGIKNITEYMLPRAFSANSFNGPLDMSSVTQIGAYGCYYMCSYSWITSINLSSLTTISSSGCESMFIGCSRLISANINSLSVINNQYSCRNMFVNCTSLTSVDLSSLQTITGNSACSGMFQGCTSLTSIDLSSLQAITDTNACSSMFQGCTSLTSVDLSSLQAITDTAACSGMFYVCTSLTSVDLSSLQTITGNNACYNMFSGCTSLTSVDLSGLQTSPAQNSITSMFQNCPNLQIVKLSDVLTKRNPTNILDNVTVQTCEYANKLEYITVSVTGLCRGNMFSTANMKKFEMVNVSTQYMFANNTNLTNISFPVLTRYNVTNAAAYMFSGCTNANFTDLYFPMLQVFKNAVPFTTTSFPSQLTIHFRKDQQTIITGTTGSASAFGGNALVFDLIGTITVNGVDYIYEAKENETGYKAWQKASSNITVDGIVYTFDISQITRNTVPVTAGDILYAWKNGSTTIFTNTLKPQVGDYIWTAFNVAQSTTPIDAVDNEYIYTIDNGEGGAEPAVGDTVYSDTTGTVFGTISSIA